MAMFAARVALLAFLAASCAVEAKGIFQAQGRISQVQREGDTITFRFAGWISSGYASAPDESPKRRWHDMGWDAVDVPVTLSGWTRAHETESRDDHPDVDRIFAELTDFAIRGRRVGFSVDNPGFQFSNKGQLKRVSGTYVYAYDLSEPARRGALKGNP